MGETGDAGARGVPGKTVRMVKTNRMFTYHQCIHIDCDTV